MPEQFTFNPVLISKFVMWIAVVVVATVLLHRHKVNPRLRIAFLIGGTLVFGFVYGFLIARGLNPNPVFAIRSFLTSVLVRGQLILPVAVMLIVLLLMVLFSNKSICGWGCQFGLLQDLMHRLRLPKWRPPFRFSNTVRIISFIFLVYGLIIAGLDWIGIVDPFQLFQFNFTLWIATFSAAVLMASMFIYRPWCQFLCPFGLVGWLLEQVSLFRPRINLEACKECLLCVEACPTQAMKDFHAGKKFHADCFACGACIAACPKDKVLRWSTRPY